MIVLPPVTDAAVPGGVDADVKVVVVVIVVVVVLAALVVVLLLGDAAAACVWLVCSYSSVSF